MADRDETYRSIWTHLMQVAFKQGYVDVGGLRTRYVEAGNPLAPAVVLIHGTGGHWEAFCANIGAYAEHFHVFAFDMKGAGFTDKPDIDYEIPDLVDFVKHFMKAVGVETASLVGVSLGAWTAARFASTYPDLVDKIVLVSPVGVARLSPAAPGHDAQVEMANRANIVNDTSWEKTRSIFKGLIHRDEDVIPDLVAMRQAIHRLPNAARDMAHVLVIGTAGTYSGGALTDEALRKIETPALIFVSEHDNPFFRNAAYAMGELMPHAQLVELSDVAHWAQFEKPEYFNEVTTKFLLS